jgi:hypothetical protein
MRFISFLLFVSSVFSIYTGLQHGFWSLINYNVFVLQIGLLLISYQLIDTDKFVEIFKNEKTVKIFIVLVLLDSLIPLYGDLTGFDIPFRQANFSNIFFYIPNLFTFSILFFSKKINKPILNFLLLYPFMMLYLIFQSFINFYNRIGQPKVQSGDNVISRFSLISLDTLEVINYNLVRVFLIFIVIYYFKFITSQYGKSKS